MGATGGSGGGGEASPLIRAGGSGPWAHGQPSPPKQRLPSKLGPLRAAAAVAAARHAAPSAASRCVVFMGAAPWLPLAVLQCWPPATPATPPPHLYPTSMQGGVCGLVLAAAAGAEPGARTRHALLLCGGRRRGAAATAAAGAGARTQVAAAGGAAGGVPRVPQRPHPHRQRLRLAGGGDGGVDARPGGDCGPVCCRTRLVPDI